MTPGARPIILDAYAARSCPVKTHNRYDATIIKPTPGDEALHELFAAGKAFEDSLLDMLAELTPWVADLRPLQATSWSERESATAEVVRAGVPVILSPSLPVDPEGHRSGHPDVLIRDVDRPDGNPGYLPVEAKRHKIVERRHTSQSPLQISSLQRPHHTDSISVDGLSVRASREADLLQMAHYWRQLEALGWSSGGQPTAGLIGTDSWQQTGGTHAICWVELRARMIRTFSRTRPDGWVCRAPLERYDHEHAFRVKVASVAQRRTGAPDDPAPMVSPIVVRECSHCDWWQSCRSLLDEDDLSLLIEKSRLDVREVSALRNLGVITVHDLALADLDELLPRYLPGVTHRDSAEERARLAARRARLLHTGVELERVDDSPIVLPAPAVEIDFDIETSATERTYLWGFLVRDVASGAEPYYKAFVRFEDLDDEGEIALAREAAEWLGQMLDANPDTLVYHYSDYEAVHVRKLARISHDLLIERMAAELDDRFVDLFTVMRRHFFGANGLGLKVVACADPGFQWRDDDPGGLNSQRWFRDAVHGADPQTRSEAAERVLAYNEDDVRATLTLRDWLRTLDS